MLPHTLHAMLAGLAGKCESSPDVVATQPLNIFAAYLTDWAQYRNITDSTYKGEAVKRPDWCKDYGYTPSHLDGALYTHLFYAFAKIDSSSFAVVSV